MEKSKHTPGPWRISRTGFSVLAGEEGEESFVRICIKPEGKVSKKEDAEWYHNARLIAAAPDLLEALVGLINCHTGAGWQTEAVQRSWWLKAQASIAKAEGK